MATRNNSEVELGVMFAEDENYRNLQNSLQETSEHIVCAHEILGILKNAALSPSVVLSHKRCSAAKADKIMRLVTIFVS